MTNYNDTMKKLAELLRLADEINAEIDTHKNALREYMRGAGLSVLNGGEHKATLKTITSARLDSAALKKELPEIAARYTVTTSAERFNFA